MSDEKTITERIAEFAEFKSKPTTGNMDYERMAHLQSLLAQAEKIVKDCEKEVRVNTDEAVRDGLPEVVCQDCKQEMSPEVEQDLIRHLLEAKNATAG